MYLLKRISLAILLFCGFSSLIIIPSYIPLKIFVIILAVLYAVVMAITCYNLAEGILGKHK